MGDFQMIRNMFILVSLTVVLSWSSVLFAQLHGTTTSWGNGTRTTFNDGTSAVTSPWGKGTRTQFYNSNSSLGRTKNTNKIQTIWGK
jgi:hypothetical protein